MLVRNDRAVRQNSHCSDSQCEKECEQNRCAKERYLPAKDANSAANGFDHCGLYLPTVTPSNVWALSRGKQREPLTLASERAPPDDTMDRLDCAVWRRLQRLVRLQRQE